MEKFLFVNSDSQALSAVKSTFAIEFADYIILEAENREIALDRLAENDIKLAVIDLNATTDESTAFFIDFFEEYPHISLIVTSNDELEDFQRETIITGADEIIIDPMNNMERLTKSVQKAIYSQSEAGRISCMSLEAMSQLIELEHRTCTLRVSRKYSGEIGLLYFKDAVLFDARVRAMTGRMAAIRIFAWDDIVIEISESCPVTVDNINSDLQTLLMEAMRVKDELTSDKIQSPDDMEVREQLEETISSTDGMEMLYQDTYWDRLMLLVADLAPKFGGGKLLATYLNREVITDFILIPGDTTYAITASPDGPRDQFLKKIIHILKPSETSDGIEGEPNVFAGGGGIIELK